MAVLFFYMQSPRGMGKVDDEAELSLYKELCKLKNINDDQYEIYFTKREGHAAVEHLFYLASGLKSQILGEDQILLV
ncbi:MAG: hypothetical protein ACLRIT_07795 [Blautia sp.]